MPTATKHDTGKPQLDLLPMPALVQTALVLGMGATKYGRFNYRLGLEHTRYYAACLRHLAAWSEGEDLDPESGLPHVAHAAANCLMLMQNILDGVGNDTRYRATATTMEHQPDTEFVPAVHDSGWTPPS